MNRKQGESHGLGEKEHAVSVASVSLLAEATLIEKPQEKTEGAVPAHRSVRRMGLRPASK